MPKVNSHQTLLFTQEDAALFSIDDAQLKADALRYDVLPRLEILLRDAIQQINEVYSADPLEHSTLALLPGFRTNRRKSGVTHHYTSCSAGITGKRSIEWSGAIRKDGSAAKVFPYRLSFELGPEGLITAFYSWFDKPLTIPSKQRFIGVIQDNWDTISQLLRIGDMSLSPCYADVLSIKQNLAHLVEDDDASISITSRIQPLPVSIPSNGVLVRCFLLLFPIYDAMIRTALERPIRFARHLQQLEDHISKNFHEFTSDQMKSPPMLRPLDLTDVISRAEKRIPVMAGTRWRVLSRDGWKCLACGRNTKAHGVVLHVDHIHPRSKGGPDHMDNYQTLCESCNLGKSNKDDTDFR